MRNWKSEKWEETYHCLFCLTWLWECASMPACLLLWEEMEYTAKTPLCLGCLLKWAISSQKTHDMCMCICGGRKMKQYGEERKERKGRRKERHASIGSCTIISVNIAERALYREKAYDMYALAIYIYIEHDVRRRERGVSILSYVSCQPVACSLCLASFIILMLTLFSVI